MNICDKCNREDTVSLKMDKTIIAKNKGNIVRSEFADKEVCPKCFILIFNSVNDLLTSLFSEGIN